MTSSSVFEYPGCSEGTNQHLYAGTLSGRDLVVPVDTMTIKMMAGYPNHDWVWHSSHTQKVAVAQALQCLTAGWTIGVRSPAEEKDFSSSDCVQTGPGAHPASCTMGTERGKARPRRDADHSPPSSAEVKYEQELLCLHGI
jgi:hypothetical protein